jgi:hypothetical protein
MVSMKWQFSISVLYIKIYTVLEKPSVTEDHTVKEARGKVSFDSQNDKYASQFSCDASSEGYL